MVELWPCGNDMTFLEQRSGSADAGTAQGVEDTDIQNFNVVWCNVEKMNDLQELGFDFDWTGSSAWRSTLPFWGQGERHS